MNLDENAFGLHAFSNLGDVAWWSSVSSFLDNDLLEILHQLFSFPVPANLSRI